MRRTTDLKSMLIIFYYKPFKTQIYKKDFIQYPVFMDQ